MPLDLQPHRAVRRRRRRGKGRARCGCCARVARAGGRAGALPATGPGCRAPPLPRSFGPGLARAGRGRDPRTGAARARARDDRPGARPGVQAGASRRPEGAGRDRDRPESGLGVGGGRRARRAGLRQPRGSLDPSPRRGQGERAGRPQPPQPGCRDRACRQQQDRTRADQRGAHARRRRDRFDQRSRPGARGDGRCGRTATP